MATANALAGIRAGARQAEVTINGIGERAGNTSLEEVVMALKTRHPVYGLETGIDTTQLSRVSKLVSNYTGISVQPNKAIVGANAFAHEAGIHQDGMLKNQQTYEIMRPEDVGVSQTNLVLGKHSGRHALRARLAEMGHALDDTELDQAFTRFKELADRKKVHHRCRPGSPDRRRVLPAALGLFAGWLAGCLRHDGHAHRHRALERPGWQSARRSRHRHRPGGCHLQGHQRHRQHAQHPAGVQHPCHHRRHRCAWRSHCARAGQERPTDHGRPERKPYSRIYGGHGADTDIIVASAKAYINALNKLIISQTEGAQTVQTDYGVMLVG